MMNNLITIQELAPKLGDRIQLCVNDKNEFTAIKQDVIGVLPTIVIIIDSNDPKYYYGVGWKSGEPSVPSAWVGFARTYVKLALTYHAMISDIDQYVMGTWLTQDVLVNADNATTAVQTFHSFGMYCQNKYCNEFNEYGQPNQSDGTTYFCYSCRNTPSYMRKL